MLPLNILINMEGNFSIVIIISFLYMYDNSVFRILGVIFSFAFWDCSAHTDCIVAEDEKVAEVFLKQVDR